MPGGGAADHVHDRPVDAAEADHALAPGLQLGSVGNDGGGGWVQLLDTVLAGGCGLDGHANGAVWRVQQPRRQHVELPAADDGAVAAQLQEGHARSVAGAHVHELQPVGDEAGADRVVAKRELPQQGRQGDVRLGDGLSDGGGAQVQAAGTLASAGSSSLFHPSRGMRL